MEVSLLFNRVVLWLWYHTSDFGWRGWIVAALLAYLLLAQLVDFVLPKCRNASGKGV